MMEATIGFQNFSTKDRMKSNRRQKDVHSEPTLHLSQERRLRGFEDIIGVEKCVLRMRFRVLGWLQTKVSQLRINAFSFRRTIKD